MSKRDPSETRRTLGPQFTGINKTNLIEIFKIAKAAKLINLTSVETLENLKDQLQKKENIFAAKKNNSHIFNATTLKRILAEAGVAGAKQLVWGEPAPGSNKLSLAETAKLAVLSTDVLQGEGAAGGGVVAQAEPTAADYGKRSVVGGLAERVKERFNRGGARSGVSETKPAAPISRKTPSMPEREKLASVVEERIHQTQVEKSVFHGFDPARCTFEGRNSYTLPEVQSLAQKYLIAVDHDDDRKDICDKLTSHWTKWMAGRLRDFFRQKNCVARSREELVKVSQDYGVQNPQDFTTGELCQQLTRKLFEMIFTARMTEFQVGDISREVVDLIMQGKFDITSSGINEKQRFAILAAASFLNPMLLEFIQVSDVKDPGIRANMKAAFNFVQQGLSLLGDAVAELDEKEVQQAAEAVADRIVAEERTKTHEEAEVAQDEGLAGAAEEEERVAEKRRKSEEIRKKTQPTHHIKSFEEIILAEPITAQDHVFIPDQSITVDALQAFEVGSLDELMPTEEAKNIIRNMHIGRLSRRKGHVSLDKGRTEVPYDGQEVEGIRILGSRSLGETAGGVGATRTRGRTTQVKNIHYIEGILLSNLNEKRLREIIAGVGGSRRDRIMAAKSFRELVAAARTIETDAFIPSPETEEILFAEVFQVGSFEEMLPTFEAREKILQGMLGVVEVGAGGKGQKMVLGHGRLTVDYDGKEIDGIEVIATERVSVGGGVGGTGSPYNLHTIDGFVLGERNRAELVRIIEANRRVPEPVMVAEEPRAQEIPVPAKEKEEEQEREQPLPPTVPPTPAIPAVVPLAPPVALPTREEIPIPTKSPAIIVEPEDLQPVPEKANLYDVISNKPGLSIFTSFINAVPEAVKVLQGEEILSSVIPDDAAVQAALRDTGNTVDTLMQNDGLKDYVLGYVTGRGEDLEKTKTIVPVLEEASNGTLRVVSYDLRMPSGMVEEVPAVVEQVKKTVPAQQVVPVAEERMVGKANIPEDYQLPEALANVIAANRVEKTKTVEPQVFVPQEEKAQEEKKSEEVEEEEMAEVAEEKKVEDKKILEQPQPEEQKPKTQIKTEDQPLEEYLNDLEGEGAPIRFFINLANSFSSASVPAEGDVLTDQLQGLINKGEVFFLSIPSDDDFMEYFGVANDELGTIQILPIEKVEEFIVSHLAVLPEAARKGGATRHTALDQTVIDEETLEIIARVTLPGGSKLVSAEGTLPEAEEGDDEEEESEVEDLDEEGENGEGEEAVEERPATVAPPKVSKRANLFEGDEDLLA